MNKAVCYVRVSTEEQAREGVSLDAQTERLEAYCKLTGLEVVKLIREEGVSASKALAKRPGGVEVLDLVRSGKVQHVVTLKLDRLFRNTIDCLQMTQQWDKANVALHLVDMGGQSFNSSSAIGRFFLTTIAAAAEMERNLIRERTIAALSHKKSHMESYGPTPYGFDVIDDTLQVNINEQQVIQSIRLWHSTGVSLRGIADRLNKANIPTKRQQRDGKPTAGKWYASTVKYLLANSLHTIQEAA